MPKTVVWPYESNELTPAQRVRMQEFQEDIRRARAADRDGFTFHIWIDGRYHDSAETHSDAFDECRAQRRAGVRDPMVIGSGSTDRTLTVSRDGRNAVRIELPD